MSTEWEPAFEPRHCGCYSAARLKESDDTVDKQLLNRASERDYRRGLVVRGRRSLFRFAPDSPLKGTGVEPPVPLARPTFSMMSWAPDAHKGFAYVIQPRFRVSDFHQLGGAGTISPTIYSSGPTGSRSYDWGTN